MGKKRKRVENVREKNPSTSDVVIPPARTSDDIQPLAKRGKWTNKQRVLVFASRGIAHRARHLMTDLRALMPHSKPETKMDRKDKIFVINEIAEMKNCNKCLYFEAKKKQDLYMWVSNLPEGPSAKFLVENIHTMDELKMTGNCLKSSRPLLSFDPTFDEQPQWALLKELFTQIFGTPEYHPKSQPFVDHVFTFSVLDNRIWFRNYQIIEEDGSLAEIGPRFVLNPIKIFEGSFRGETLFENPHYVSPNEYRRYQKRQVAGKYLDRIAAQKSRDLRYTAETYSVDPTDDVFSTVKSEDSSENISSNSRPKKRKKPGKK